MAQRVYPLPEVVASSDSVLLGRVAYLDRDRQHAVLRVDAPLKAKAPWRWMDVDVRTGGWDHPRALVHYLSEGLPLVLFVGHAGDQQIAMGYTNGLWFRMSAPKGAVPDRLAWDFNHIDLGLPRTFSGSTSSLARALGWKQGDLQSRPVTDMPEYLKRARPPSSLAYFEGETLRVLDSTFSAVEPIWQIAQVRGGDYNFRSAGTVLVCSAEEGQTLSLELEAPRDGLYDLHLLFARIENVGSPGVSVNGQARRDQGSSTAQHDSSTAPRRPRPFGPGARLARPFGRDRVPVANNMIPDNGGPDVLRVYPRVRLKRGPNRLTLAPRPEGGGGMVINLDAVALCPPGGIRVTPSDRAALAAAKVQGPQEARLVALCRQFYKEPREVAALYEQARGNWRDVAGALRAQRTFGQGGPRGLVRPASYFLRLKQSNPWLSWVDVEAVMHRGSEIYYPTKDGNEIIAGLIRDFSWDEVDPLVSATKYQNLRIEDWVQQQKRERRTAPVVAGEKAGPTLFESSGGASISRWRPVAGGSGPREPTAGAPIPLDGSVAGSLRSVPPTTTSGGLVWFSANQDGSPTRAAYSGTASATLPCAGSYLVEFEVYVPDHVYEQGLQRNGVFQMWRDSRAVALGIAGADGTEGSVRRSPPAWLNAEPVLDRFTWERLRLDVRREGGTWRALVTSHRGDGMEIARAVCFLGRASEPLRLVPLFGLGRVGQGYVAEAFVRAIRVRQVTGNLRVVNQMRTGTAEALQGGPMAVPTRLEGPVMPGSSPVRQVGLPQRGLAVALLGASIVALLGAAYRQRRSAVGPGGRSV
jgi:hypothetical protein